jgi:hypothetical protein
VFETLAHSFPESQSAFYFPLCFYVAPTPGAKHNGKQTASTVAHAIVDYQVVTI